MIPKASKFNIVEKPDTLGLKSNIADLIAVLQIMDRENTIKTTLVETGFQTVTGLRASLRIACKKLDLNTKVVKQGDVLYIFNK